MEGQTASVDRKQGGVLHIDPKVLSLIESNAFNSYG